jgi:hypothetical protein
MVATIMTALTPAADSRAEREMGRIEDRGDLNPVIDAGLREVEGYAD